MSVEAPPCTHCDQPVDLTANHAIDPLMHVWCLFDQRRTAPPAPAVAPDRELRNWLSNLATLGYAITGPWYELWATTAETPTRHGHWDIPATHPLGPHLPWVEIAQTPCPGNRRVEPGGWDFTVTCRNKHHHPVGKR